MLFVCTAGFNLSRQAMTGWTGRAYRMGQCPKISQEGRRRLKSNVPGCDIAVKHQFARTGAVVKAPAPTGSDDLPYGRNIFSVTRGRCQMCQSRLLQLWICGNNTSDATAQGFISVCSDTVGLAYFSNRPSPCPLITQFQYVELDMLALVQFALRSCTSGPRGRLLCSGAFETGCSCCRLFSECVSVARQSVP